MPRAPLRRSGSPSAGGWTLAARPARAGASAPSARLVRPPTSTARQRQPRRRPSRRARRRARWCPARTSRRRSQSWRPWPRTTLLRTRGCSPMTRPRCRQALRRPLRCGLCYALFRHPHSVLSTVPIALRGTGLAQRLQHHGVGAFAEQRRERRPMRTRTACVRTSSDWRGAAAARTPGWAASSRLQRTWTGCIRGVLAHCALTARPACGRSAPPACSGQACTPCPALTAWHAARTEPWPADHALAALRAGPGRPRTGRTRCRARPTRRPRQPEE